ncbi:MAG: hypothetical protein U1F43_28175 [Myxococcota bacterium]
MLTRIPVLLSFLVMVSLAACSTGAIGVGYSVPTGSSDAPDAWRLEARLASGGIVKVGAAARSRLGDGLDQLAIAPELSVEMSPGPVTVGARVGVNLLQLDRDRGEWTVAAGSPYLQPLVQFRLGDPIWLFVGATLELDLRPHDEPNQLYVGAQVGVGFDL